MYDLCIVGAGMVGSSAARHASNIPNTQVCLIGPKEPRDQSSSTIFAAYYDEGRITESLENSDPIWKILTRQSVDRYREIEKRTGITFYSENGFLLVGPNESTTGYDTCAQVMTPQEARSSFPHIYFEDDHTIVFQPKQAGYINPRKLVLAQQTAARLQGCDIIDDLVKEIREDKQSDDSVVMCVECESGQVIHSKKVLLATGAFTAFRKLLPAGVIPDVALVTQTVVLAEPPPEQLKLMQAMPTLLYYGGMEGTNNNYSLPPILYPDGKYYLKLGHVHQFETELKTEAEVAEWYKSQPPQQYKDGLLKIVNAVYPGLKPVSVKYETCVTTNTPNRSPYIDCITPNIGVALAGNGRSAMCCDEFGNLAVQLILHNKWDIPLPKEDFKLRQKFTKSMF